MRKKEIAILIFVFTLITATLSAQKEDYNKHINKFGQLLFYVNNYYLDTLNNEKITEAAIRSVLLQLDPHSSYITAKDVKAMNEPLEGNFEGVGIEFAIIRDTLTVASPIAGGPSERVGIRAGDKIVSIDGESVASKGLTNDMVFKYLRGPKESKVNLTIIRRGVKGELSFEVVRDRIPINSLDAAYEVQPGVLYVKLSRFASNSAQEIINSILEINPGIIKGFILDLRGNSGGFLGTALEISNFFLEAGQTIVYTEGMRIPQMTEKAKGTGFYRKGALVVLIDENSASASEIVAGAIQDWDRGLVIGRRSFGKGLVQQMLPLNDGSQLRLTVARYHTPSGRVIQSPYEAGSSDKYYKSFLERYNRGESFNRDSIQFPDSLKYKTLIKGRTVYGGGGIMPDVFVAADTTGYSDYYANLLRRGVIPEFMNDYTDRKRAALKEKYRDFSSFEKSFHVEEEMLSSLKAFALEKGVVFDQEGFNRSRDEIKIYLKALTARTLFGTTGYFRIINSSNDPIFSKAIEALAEFDAKL
ncbi:MAG: S41 family peptidase [Bacteroidales bacterium]|jgi:carboxyl-terminal processing protease|nr:S41 family peptidase [Bacteroidales bacterium]